MILQLLNLVLLIVDKNFDFGYKSSNVLPYTLNTKTVFKRRLYLKVI